MEKCEGKVAGILFSNKTNGFCVFKLKISNGSVIRACGTFPGVKLENGLKVELSGRNDKHPTYGPQFTATSCQVIPELGRNGVTSYLINNVNSIGIVTASRLYDAFGDDLLNILNNEPEKLKECSFLTKRQFESIIAEWQSSHESKNSSIYLSNLGLNTSQIKSIYTIYGAKTREVVSNNPYLLLKCPGVGISAADNAARILGINVNDPKRVEALVLFSIEELSNSDGHMYVTSSQVLSYSSRRLFKKYNLEPFQHGDYISESQYYKAVTSLISKGEIINNNDLIYINTNWRNEDYIAKHLARAIISKPFTFKEVDNFISDYEKNRKIKFSEDQINALKILEKSRIAAISGYPGTGKTTLISALVSLFDAHNLDFTLLSPTGIAAKRLTQVTKRTATTIHRALGYKKDGTWEFHSGNKYHIDAIIIDEMSMVDSNTFYHLLSALSEETIIVMVGDSAQLPSVGSGYVFNNILSCNSIPNISLTHIFRQGKTSDIISVAHSILNNRDIEISSSPDSEFVFFNMPESNITKEICQLTLKLKNLGRNFQVISPMHDGELGVNNLNQELRDVLNADCINNNVTFIKSGETGLYTGDRVMVVKNDYDKMVFNGDVGKIIKINTKNDEVDVKIFGWFDQDSSSPKYIDKVITFTIEEARLMLKVAYACTAHKVQGQEFDYIIMPMTNQFGVMLYKNLVYTAITRAKKKVFIFGNPYAFMSAVKNERETLRNSNLSSLIRDHYKIACAEQVMSS